MAPRALLLAALLGACAYARDQPDAACALVPSGGCPVGEGCSIDPAGAAEGTVSCRVVSRSGEDVAPCDLEAECAPGWTCQDQRCKRYCHVDADCGGPGGLCILPVVVTGPTGLPVTASGVLACTPDCDPIASTGCPTPMGCQILKEPSGSRFHTECLAAGTGIQLDPCTTSSDCAPGFVCQSSDGSLVCLRRCTLAGPCDIPATDCTAQTARPTVGGVEYGVCLP